jgi:hypothetical protein
MCHTMDPHMYISINSVLPSDGRTVMTYAAVTHRRRTSNSRSETISIPTLSITQCTTRSAGVVMDEKDNEGRVKVFCV